MEESLKRIGKQISGIIDVKNFGGGYLIPDSNQVSYKIYISKKNMGKSLSGDKVEVTITDKLPNVENAYEAQVTKIIKRKTLRFTGLFEKTKKGTSGFVRPHSKKIPVDIYIPESHFNNAEHGDVVIAKITNWKDEERLPLGVIVKNLGKSGEHTAEMAAILFDNEIEENFPDFVQKEADSISFEIPEEEIKNRVDFRGVTTFTIDPEQAKDFDDAISFKRLSDNEYEIGVHIADVSHYVQPGTSLDREAYTRATSVYLVDRVIPMLPERLSNGVCSLRPGEDKLCFSAVFRVMEKDGEIIFLDTKFEKTIIHSQKRFTYEEAQDIIEGKSDRNELVDFVSAIKKLDSIAKIIRKQRFAQGAIYFGKREVKFKLDENKKPIDVYLKTQKDAHKLIEEFMLLANQRVSEFVAKLEKPYIYRTHDLPNHEKLTELSRLAKDFGYDLQIYSDAKKTKQSLNELLVKISGSGEENMLQTLAVRAMSKAIYSPEATGHYGLAFDYYSHFTSPIRRYPDIIAHRLLWKYLNNKDKVNEKSLEKSCNHCSIYENKAARAERESIKFKQVEFLKNKIGTIYEAVITDINDNGVYAEIIENGCEGFIGKDDLMTSDVMIDKSRFSIVLQNNEVKKLGDTINIEVKKVSLNKKQIDFLIRN